MTERAPGDDTRAQDREEVALDSSSVGQPASAHGNPGAIAVPEEPIAPLVDRLVRRQPDGHGDRDPGRRPDRTAGRRRAEGAQPVGLRTHPLLPSQDGGDQPDRAVRHLPRCDLRRNGWRPTASTSSTSSTSPHRRRRGQASLRHRPARPRLSQPRHLRPADVALGRVLRRLPLDHDRDDDRLAGRLLRRRARQPADAVHRPDPDAAHPRSAADRGHLLRQRGPAQGGPDPGPSAVDEYRPHRPRASSSRSARRSTSRPRRRVVPAMPASSCVTCSRTPSGRSSSTRR